jgi:hypothetical protein
MDIWSSLLISVFLLTASIGLMFWHISSWRNTKLDDLPANEMDFYRRQFRRRIQTSAMLGVLAIGLYAWEILTKWVTSQLILMIYIGVMFILVIWVALLAFADIWATKYHFGRLHQKCLIEQAKLNAEVRRVQSVRGNGKQSVQWNTENSEDAGEGN